MKHHFQISWLQLSHYFPKQADSSTWLFSYKIFTFPGHEKEAEVSEKLQTCLRKYNKLTYYPCCCKPHIFLTVLWTALDISYELISEICIIFLSLCFSIGIMKFSTKQRKSHKHSTTELKILFNLPIKT